jgi:predicted ArsR family transcriptional regulator
MSELGAVGFGDSQADVLRAVKRLGEATLGELAASLGLARETLRDHCRGLAAQGLVERAGVRRSGPGRPQVVYRLSARGEELFPRREGELLAELARFLLATGGEGHLERFFAERAERRRPALERRVAGLDGEDRLREVAAILSEQGYLAEPAAGTAEGGVGLRLCHCPLRDLVAVSQLPCRAEMALVEHLLGAPLARESFMPDGSPSCTYRLAPRPTGASATADPQAS